MTKFTILLVGALFLFSSWALAAETEKDLINAGKEMDKAAASPQGAEKVTQRLAERYNVPESTIRDLRAQKLGFGEISILLALSQATGKSTAELLQRFKAGEGWGKLANDEGVKLGQVISAVERAHPDAQAQEAGPKARGREEMGPAERPASPGATPGAGPGGPSGRGMGRGRR